MIVRAKVQLELRGPWVGFTWARRFDGLHLVICLIPFLVMRAVVLRCEACEARCGVRMESSRTAYEWDGLGLDPNRPVPLCRPCAAEHHAYWDDQWRAYERSILA